MKNKKIKRRVGDVVALVLHDGTYSFGQVLHNLIAFYDLNTSKIPPLDEILKASIAFKICVMAYAITDAIWQVIGNSPPNQNLLEEPLFFKKDIISKQLSIYRDSTGEETPATVEECKGLECAAVWDPEHVVDRLSDHFAGRPNKWVESMLPEK